MSEGEQIRSEKRIDKGERFFWIIIVFCFAGCSGVCSYSNIKKAESIAELGGDCLDKGYSPDSCSSFVDKSFRGSYD